MFAIQIETSTKSAQETHRRKISLCRSSPAAWVAEVPSEYVSITEICWNEIIGYISYNIYISEIIYLRNMFFISIHIFKIILVFPFNII